MKNSGSSRSRLSEFTASFFQQAPQQLSIGVLFGLFSVKGHRKPSKTQANRIQRKYCMTLGYIFRQFLGPQFMQRVPSAFRLWGMSILIQILASIPRIANCFGICIRMYIYIYIYLQYIYIYTYIVYTCANTYIILYIHIFICMYIHIYVRFICTTVTGDSNLPRFKPPSQTGGHPIEAALREQ